MNDLLQSAFEKIYSDLQVAPYIDLAEMTQCHQRERSEVSDWIESRVLSAPSEVQDRLREEFFGNGPLVPLLKDETITEILVNGKDSIWYERNGRLLEFRDHFCSQLTYENFFRRLCHESGMQITLDLPFADGHWKGYRLHLLGAPIVKNGPVLCFRNHPKTSWNFGLLSQCGWSTEEGIEALIKMIEDRENFIIVGPTGSGKTSVLNACLGEIPPNERVVIIEDVEEIASPNSASTKLLTRTDPQRVLREVDQSELVRQTLRMRPERIVMSEIRGAEAKDLLMALATGHSGSIGTLHGESARQALIRLEMMIQMGAPQWSLTAIRTLIWMSLQSVIVVNKDENGKRYLEGIYRITSLDDCGFLIEKRF